MNPRSAGGILRKCLRFRVITMRPCSRAVALIQTSSMPIGSPIASRAAIRSPARAASDSPRGVNLDPAQNLVPDALPETLCIGNTRGPVAQFSDTNYEGDGVVVGIERISAHGRLRRRLRNTRGERLGRASTI